MRKYLKNQRKDLIEKKNHRCFIANDNTTGQLVISGRAKDLQNFIKELKGLGIKNIILPVSGPFHCELMNKATKVMQLELNKLNFKNGKNILISNVSANPMQNSNEIQGLLIKQIESRVRWRESVHYMIEAGIDQFIEIGPGKVLSGLIKRINRTVKVNAINNEEDINIIKKDDKF